MDTVACEMPESGESTGSKFYPQRAREGLGGGPRGDRGGEATLGTKADSADTSHPLGARLSLAPWGMCSLEELPAESTHCGSAAASASGNTEQTKRW